ncbi:hypothetical protein AHF37_05445 [Paragonimus kellicotti]|nr:hypothetical protein AHF37_05445 [Paragonimus kellicotti]
MSAICPSMSCWTLNVALQPKSIDFGSRSSATIISTSVKSERPSGVASLWYDVVTRLEQSVEGELVSDDYKQVLKSIKLLRQFAVASTTNKTVVSNSDVLRPRLLELLSRFQSWSAQQLEVCLDLCGLVNSLVRECPTLSEHILSHPTILNQLLEDRTLASLINLFRSTTTNTPVDYSSTHDQSGLTNNARCYLMQLLALLATDTELATRLNRLNAVEVCHQIILATVCGHYPRSSMATATAFRLGLSTRSNISVSPLGCAFAINPSNQLAARFALKLLVHLFFHVADALDKFKEVYRENDPFRLIACYGHMTNSVPPNVTGVSYQQPPGYRSKRTRKLTTTDLHSSTDSTSVGVDTVCSPSDRYPLAGRENRCPTPGHMIVPVIQPLTEGCLQSEDIRILSWICHVLVLVPGHRSELYLWTVYTNSFIREVDSRVSSMLHAVQGASDHHEHVQFIEHLIPLVKLFACLASSSEAVRVLFTETSMCNKLVDFAINLKSMGVEHVTLVLEFQHEHVQFIEHLIPLVKLFACLASSSEAVRVLFTETSMCNKLVDFAINLKSMGVEHVTLVLEFQVSF